MSMPSRAYTSFLPWGLLIIDVIILFSVNALSGLYLISTLLVWDDDHNPGKSVSMPSRAYTSFLRRFTLRCLFDKRVSMPSRAYTSFLRSPFKNLDFMRFSEPVFAGIYQNILITAVFRAC